jgi:hypothetical protein
LQAPVDDGLELLQLFLVLLLRALWRHLEPLDCLIDGVLQLGDGVQQIVGVRLKAVLGCYAGNGSLVLGLTRKES